MKIMLFLFALITFLSCDLNKSYEFAYNIETDFEITSDIVYYLDSVYEEEEITTPWQSDSMTIADDFFSFYIRIENSASGGCIYILRDGKVWQSKEFSPGYQIEFSEEN